MKEIACRAKEVALMDLMGRTLAVEGAWEKSKFGGRLHCDTQPPVGRMTKNGVAISSDTIFLLNL